MLVVDDDANILRLVHTCLARAGIRAAVCDGAAAMQCYAALRPSVVLLDLRLGHGLWGSDIALELKARESAPAVVLMSGQPDLQRTAARIGADGVLAKPFHPHDLVALVSSLLNEDSRAV